MGGRATLLIEEGAGDALLDYDRISEILFDRFT